MTFNELTKMRKLRARPAMAIILTDDNMVHEFCAANDFPVIWTPSLPGDQDFSSLHNLQVWVIHSGSIDTLLEKVRTHSPSDLWITGFYGFSHRVSKAIGRALWTS
jgi:hypothetical protein